MILAFEASLFTPSKVQVPTQGRTRYWQTQNVTFHWAFSVAVLSSNVSFPSCISASHFSVVASYHLNCLMSRVSSQVLPTNTSISHQTPSNSVLSSVPAIIAIGPVWLRCTWLYWSFCYTNGTIVLFVVAEIAVVWFPESPTRRAAGQTFLPIWSAWPHTCRERSYFVHLTDWRWEIGWIDYPVMVRFSIVSCDCHEISPQFSRITHEWRKEGNSPQNCLSSCLIFEHLNEIISTRKYEKDDNYPFSENRSTGRESRLPNYFIFFQSHSENAQKVGDYLNDPHLRSSFVSLNYHSEMARSKS